MLTSFVDGWVRVVETNRTDSIRCVCQGEISLQDSNSCTGIDSSLTIEGAWVNTIGKVQDWRYWGGKRSSLTILNNLVDRISQIRTPVGSDMYVADGTLYKLIGERRSWNLIKLVDYSKEVLWSCIWQCFIADLIDLRIADWSSDDSSASWSDSLTDCSE